MINKKSNFLSETVWYARVELQQVLTSREILCCGKMHIRIQLIVLISYFETHRYDRKWLENMFNLQKK